METKTLTFKIPEEAFIKCYLTLFNGALKLTSTEIDILEAFIKEYAVLSKSEITEEQISMLLFNTTTKKSIRDKVGITSEHSFNNCISSLKKKGVIVKDSFGYKIASKLIPAKSVTFNFVFS